MKSSATDLFGRVLAIVGSVLLATAFGTAFAADSTLVGAWQLDSGQSGQVALYLFTSTR